MSVNQTTSTISVIAEAIKGYAIEREFQKTERQRIAAQLRAFNKLIDSKSELINKLIEAHFHTLDNLMENLNMDFRIALEKDHPEIASETLKMLTNTVNTTLNNTFSNGIKMINDGYNMRASGALNQPDKIGLLNPGGVDE